MTIFDTYRAAVLALAKWRPVEPEPTILADNNVVLISDVFRLCLDNDDVMPMQIAAMVTEAQRPFWKPEHCLQWGASFGQASKAMMQIGRWKAGE